MPDTKSRQVSIGLVRPVATELPRPERASIAPGVGQDMESNAQAGHESKGDGSSLSVLNQVRALIIRLSPEPICDDCVTEKLNLSSREFANQKTRELAGLNGFERRRDICSLCFREKLVNRRI